MTEKCQEANTKFRTIYLPGATRWGGKVSMVVCFDQLLPAFRLITDADMSTIRQEDGRRFTELLDHALVDYELLQACLPLLMLVFEWTQICTSAFTSTAGLVLLMVNRIHAALGHLNSLSTIDGVDVTLRNKIRQAYSGLKRYADEYYNDDFCGFWIYKV
jgi:hypothetical protein